MTLPYVSFGGCEVAAFLGDAEGTVGAVERSVDAGLIDRLWLERCPLLDFVRSDARMVEAQATLQVRAEGILAALTDDE